MKPLGWTALALGILALSLGSALVLRAAGKVEGIDSDKFSEVGAHAASLELANSQQPRSAVGDPGAAVCTFEVQLSSTVSFSISAVSFDLVFDDHLESLHSEIRGARVFLATRRPLAGSVMLVRSQGFCDTSVALDACPKSPVQVVLVPEVALAGRVDRTDGTPIGVFTLVAWPAGQHFEPLAFDPVRHERNPRGVLTCRCEPDGTFAFRGAQSTLYRIYGGGDGWVLAERSAFVTAPREGWNAKSQPLFAALAEFRDANGDPVSISPERGVVLQFGSSNPQVQPMAGRAFEAVLAGLAPKFLDVQAHQWLALVTGPVALQSTAPWRLELEVPGYAPFTREFIATRLDIPPSTIDCRLARTAEGFGTVEVQLVGGPSLEPGDRLPAGIIRLLGADGTAYSKRHPGVVASTRLEGVPWGTYRVTFRSELGGAVLPPPQNAPIEVRVGAEVARVEIRMETTAILDLDLVDQSGAEYRGPLEIRLMRSTGDGGSAASTPAMGMFPVSFEAPPYSVSLASGGDWLLAFGWPRPDTVVHPSPYESIQVTAGAHTRHTIAVRSP